MEPVAEHESSNESGEGDDGAEGGGINVKELLLFGLRALRHNLLLALSLAAVIGALGSVVVAALPQVYESTFRIFVQEGGSITSAIASGKDHSVPLDPARGLEEYLLARDNLLSIVREIRLFEKWPMQRSLPLRIKDRISERLFGPPDRQDMEHAFVEMLALGVSGAKEGDSVRVKAQWRDGVTAYEIAKLVERNFLAARAAREFGPIQRAIPFLEAQLEEADKATELAASALAEKAATGAVPTPDLGLPLTVKPKSGAPDPALAQLATASARLSAVRREERELSEPWQKRISELKAQLVDMKALYSDEHPKVLQLEARIAAASEVPEELAALRAEEAELKNVVASRRAAASRPVADEGAEAEPGMPAVPAPRKNVADAELASASTRAFLAALGKSEEISRRLESARIELAAAQAEFEHRYVVIAQPEVPNKPLKNKKPMFFVLVYVLGVLAGIGAATWRELKRDRLVESWQVRTLGVPLLAEVELKKLPPPNDA